jgi:hypothetical protein
MRRVSTHLIDRIIRPAFNNSLIRNTYQVLISTSFAMRLDVQMAGPAKLGRKSDRMTTDSSDVTTIFRFPQRRRNQAGLR